VAVRSPRKWSIRMFVSMRYVTNSDGGWLSPTQGEADAGTQIQQAAGYAAARLWNGRHSFGSDGLNDADAMQ